MVMCTIDTKYEEAYSVWVLMWGGSRGVGGVVLLGVRPLAFAFGRFALQGVG